MSVEQRSLPHLALLMMKAHVLVNSSIERMDYALQTKHMEVEDTAEEIDNVLAEVSDEAIFKQVIIDIQKGETA